MASLTPEEMEDLISVLYERVRLLEQVVNAHVGIDSRSGMPHPSQRTQALEFASGLVLSPLLSGPADGAVLTADSAIQGGLKWQLPSTDEFLAQVFNARFTPTSADYVALNPSFRSTSTLTVTSGTCYFVPFVIGRTVTLTLFGISVSTAATGSAEIAIYRSDGTNGRPYTRLLRVSGLDTGSTGVKSGSISLALEPGIYWAAVRCSAAPALRATNEAPAIGISSGGTLYTMLTNTDSALNNPVTTDPTTLSGSQPPVFYARY